MEFDWGTFAIELANFVVLVWLLQRFLYRPVLAAVARRQQAQRDAERATQALRDEALALKARYEAGLAEVATSRAAGLEALGAELAEQRKQRYAELDAELDAERQRRELNAARRDDDRRREGEHQALALGAAFAARLLQRVADANLEQRLVALVLADLQGLDDTRRAALRASLVRADVTPRVASAYPLAAALQDALGAALADIAGRPLTPAFVQVPALLAGLRIEVGDWVAMANLRDELQFFAGGLDDGG